MDDIVYVENPREATKKLLELISEVSKLGRQKSNTQNTIAFLYAINN